MTEFTAAVLTFTKQLSADDEIKDVPMSFLRSLKEGQYKSARQCHREALLYLCS